MRNGKLKVLEISSYPPPLAGWGMRVHILKKVMESQSHVCEVLNIGKGRFQKGRDFIPVFGAFDYARKVFKHRRKGFLIHMHLNGDSPKGMMLSILALTISLLTFRRPVVTFHAGPVQKYFPQSQAPGLMLVFKYIFTVPRHIICNSNVEKKAIQGYGIPARKIIPIQAFTRQYLEFSSVVLPEKIENFYQRFPFIISCYLFYRPQYFIEEMMNALEGVIAKRKDVGILIMGPDRETEPIKKLINRHGLDKHILLTGNQQHDNFLTIIKNSHIYLRTHWKDGVCSSVLEALSLGVPVVAAENGTRPPSVITYENENISDMRDKILSTIENYEDVKACIVKPDIPDTVVDEMAVLSDEVAVN